MDLNEKIAELESQLTGDMMADMDIREQIYNLKKKGEKPVWQEITCEGCGS